MKCRKLNYLKLFFYSLHYNVQIKKTSNNEMSLIKNCPICKCLLNLRKTMFAKIINVISTQNTENDACIQCIYLVTHCAVQLLPILKKNVCNKFSYDVQCQLLALIPTRYVKFVTHTLSAMQQQSIEHIKVSGVKFSMKYPIHHSESIYQKFLHQVCIQK